MGGDEEMYVTLSGGGMEEISESKDQLKKKTKSSKSSSRKSKSSSSSSKSKSKSRVDVNNGVVKTSLFLLANGILLILKLLCSILGGREKRSLAWGNLTRSIRMACQTAKSSPLFALKVTVCLLVLFALVLPALSFLGVDTTSMTSSMSGPFNFFDQSDSSAVIATETLSNQDETNEEEEVIPEATGGEVKKMTRKLEIQFACDEVDCIEKCANKVTKKCATSENCIKTRIATCKKKCRKARCESRCKFEPALGYVEREMKMDKCKEDCGSQGPKCIDKCEKQFQTCKSRCPEKRKKFSCDRQPNLPVASNGKEVNNAKQVAEVVEVEEDDNDDFGGDAGGNSNNGIEDEEI